MAGDVVTYANAIDQHPSTMSCVYAISGTYGVLPRFLYYITMLFSIFGRSLEWLVVGALVSALTYAATSAIHEIALISSKKHVFDLDIIGAWAILSTGAISYIVMIHWSSTLRRSSNRAILIAWGILVAVALIFGRVSLFDNQLSDPEPACYSSTNVLLQFPEQLDTGLFNCTYACFSIVKPMREASEVLAIPHSVLTNSYSYFAYGLVGPIMFVAYAALSLDSHEHTPSQLCTRFTMKYLDPKHHEELTRKIYEAASEQWYGGYILLYQFVHRSRWSLRKLWISVLVMPWVTLELFVDLISIPLMVLNILLNEINIIGSELPANEANFAIGQWGPVVSSGFVVIAALMSRYLERRQMAKIARREEKEEMISIKSNVLATPLSHNLDEPEGQESGVVKPGMAHVKTLEDM